MNVLFSESICAANGAGMWLYPGDCRKYAWCAPPQGQWLMECALGTVFDQDIQNCNWPDDVDHKYGCS